MESSDWFDLIHVLASRATRTWIVLPFWILLWLRWKLTFLLKTKSRCELCKSIFQICHALSKLSVDCLLLFNECMQHFLKISSRRWSIKRCISMRILEIMVCLEWWLWSCALFYHSSNWNLGDFFNQGCMFVSMGYDWAFENYLKHGLVHGGIPWKKAKLDNHWLSVHWFHGFDTQCHEQILIDHSFSILVPRLF